MLVVIAILFFLILLVLLYGRTRVRRWLGNLLKGLLVLLLVAAVFVAAVIVREEWSEPTALRWKEVIAKPEFQQLSTQEQQGVQLQYFEDVVASRLPTKEHEAAWHQFTSEYPYSSMGPSLQEARRKFASVQEAWHKREAALPAHIVNSQLENFSEEELRKLSAEEFNYLGAKYRAVLAPALWLNPGDKSILWRERGLLWNTVSHWVQDNIGRITLAALIFLFFAGLPGYLTVERRDKIRDFFKRLKGWLSHHTPK